jgi:curved DNA-binding protein CbpA
MENLYEILGVKSNATLKEIKKRHKILAKQYHPDKNPGNKDSEEQFKKMQAAYETLSDDLKRNNYDASFAEPVFTYRAANTFDVQYHFDWKEALAFIILLVASIFLIVNIFSTVRKK